MPSRLRFLALPLLICATPLAAQDKAPEVKYITAKGSAATLPRVANLDGIERDLIILGKRVA